MDKEMWIVSEKGGTPLSTSTYAQWEYQRKREKSIVRYIQTESKIIRQQFDSTWKKKNIKCQYRQFYNYKRQLNHIFLYLIACNFNVGPIMDKCNVFDNNSTNKDGQK